MPDIPLDIAPPFVALPSTDNIPIESSWHLFTNHSGCDIKQILRLGKSLNYFNPGSSHHVYVLLSARGEQYSLLSSDLFNWLWPKIVQLSLDDFVDYWNNHKIRTQRSKILPSGVSPNYIFDFPDRFGLIKFGEPAPQHFVDALRKNIPISRQECYRWVSDEFDTQAWEIYTQIGSPKLVLTDGWTIFCQMLPHLIWLLNNSFRLFYAAANE